MGLLNGALKAELLSNIEDDAFAFEMEPLGADLIAEKIIYLERMLRTFTRRHLYTGERLVIKRIAKLQVEMERKLSH